LLTPFEDSGTVPTALDNLPSGLETNRRFARLAITWFAVDPHQVEETLRAVQDRISQGQDADFLRAAVGVGLLTHDQAESLRLDHAPTQIYLLPGAELDAEKPKYRTPHGNGIDSGEPTRMGPYRILRRLGQGGMGAVYLAFDAKENRQVAVKVLAADQAPKPNILLRFQREGLHGAILTHANIVRSLDAGQDSATGLHYIVLEFVDGPSAHDLLDRTGKLQVGDAVHIILDIARALEHAHKNRIIHRDIKPANILITASGLAKLSDLGLAKRRDDSANLTSATQGIGTPYYMPYEQAMNAKMADERSDVYALGATLYHLVTGEVPFQADTSLEIVEKKGIGVYPPASTINPEVPPLLDGVLALMLARDPENRFQTVSEAIVELERSQLAAAIPSFVSLDSAMQDPVVKKRLTTPIQATQPDMQFKQPSQQQTWFLRYRDQRGNLCKLKGSAAQIIERLRKGTIPRQAEAARSAQGTFKPISNWPEFHDAATPIAQKVSERKEQLPISDRWWWLALAACAGIVGLLLTIVWLLVREG
jgi:eukaryotic-like serine/threonine-protein kinase